VSLHSPSKASSQRDTAKETSGQATKSQHLLGVKFGANVQISLAPAVGSAYVQQALVQLTILRLSRMPFWWATRGSKSAEAQGTSAVLQPELWQGPKLHKVMFRVECYRAGGGGIKAVRKASDRRV